MRDQQQVRRRRRFELSRWKASLLLSCLLIGGSSVRAEVPTDRIARLHRGLNVAHWFRFPPQSDPTLLRDYLSAATLDRIRAAGFTYIRLPVQPQVIAPAGASPATRSALRSALRSAIERIETAGLGVEITPFPPTDWHLETTGGRRLAGFWQVLSAAIAGLDPDMTFPEIVNEPVFQADPEKWARLQAVVLAEIRRTLPAATVVLTGNDFSSLDGLLRLTPVPDENVVYSFHFYEPTLLTTLGAFEPGLDTAALSRLPFPVGPDCEAGVAPPPGRTEAVVDYYCAQGWDAAQIAARLRLAGEWARRHRSPVIMEEFGAAAGLRAPSRLAWLTAVRSTVDCEGIGWALWAYDDPLGFGASPLSPDTATLDPGVLHALGLQ